MMETWHWVLVGVGSALFSGIVGFIYYRSRHHHSQQKHINYHQNPAIFISGDDQTSPPCIVEEDNSSSHFQDSRSATPNAYILAPLSAPPPQFFRDQSQPRWISPATTPKSPSSPSPVLFQNGNTNTSPGAGWTDNYRFLSLSPFLGHTHPSTSPSPESICSAQTRTPSPTLAKLATTWKRYTRSSMI